MYPAGQIFLRMLFMTVVPIVFTSIALGVAGIGDMKTLGRLGGRTFGYFLLSTLIAATIGLTLVKEIADLHQGHIQLENQDDGVTATFTIPV